MLGVLVAVEGDTDEPFARRIVEAAGLHIERVYVFHGHGNLDARIPRWCETSNRRPMMILRDLDPHLGINCAPGLVERLSGSGPRSSTTLVRIAEREIEAWLLADRGAVAEYFHVRPEAIPDSPDDQPDPKRTLVNLCRQSSSNRVRNGMVPGSKSGRRVGPEFTGLVLDFAGAHWDAQRARTASPSLNKAINALNELPSRRVRSSA
jgi:hypothetical protein